MWFCSKGKNDGGGYLSNIRQDDPGCREIETHSLSQLGKSLNIKSVDLVKLDVEGFEHVLLGEGIPFWDDYSVKHIVVEMSIDKSKPERSVEVFKAMEKRGFAARRVQGLYAFPWFRRVDLANWIFSRGKP